MKAHAVVPPLDPQVIWGGVDPPVEFLEALASVGASLSDLSPARLLPPARKAAVFGVFLLIEAVNGRLRVKSPLSGKWYTVRANGTCSCRGGRRPECCWHVRALVREYGFLTEAFRLLGVYPEVVPSPVGLPTSQIARAVAAAFSGSLPVAPG